MRILRCRPYACRRASDAFRTIKRTKSQLPQVFHNFFPLSTSALSLFCLWLRKQKAQFWINGGTLQRYAQLLKNHMSLYLHKIEYMGTNNCFAVRWELRQFLVRDIMVIITTKTVRAMWANATSHVSCRVTPEERSVKKCQTKLLFGKCIKSKKERDGGNLPGFPAIDNA